MYGLKANAGFFRLLMKEIFGTYETLGSVSVVFADNQSENKIEAISPSVQNMLIHRCYERNLDSVSLNF